MVDGAALCGLAESRRQRVPAFLKKAEPRLRSTQNRDLILFDPTRWCHLPSCATVQGNGQVNASVEHHAGDIAVLKWIVTDFWPPIRGPVIPENLPPDGDGS